MMIVYSKEFIKNYEKLKALLTSIVWSFGHDRGINHSFLGDSEIINDSIEAIATRIAWLLENTNLDKNLLEFIDSEVKKGRYKKEGD